MHSRAPRDWTMQLGKAWNGEFPCIGSRPSFKSHTHTHIADTALCWQGVTINSPTQYDWLSSINLLKEYLGLSLEINHWIYVGVGGYAIPQRSLTPLSILHYFSIRIDFAFLQLPAGTLRDSDLKQSKRYRKKKHEHGKMDWMIWWFQSNIPNILTSNMPTFQ